MIVLLHSKLYFPWPWLNYAPGSLVAGVSFFFVLSGFILTHVYTSKPFPGYGRFMLARFARLWPIHVFTLLMVVTFMRPDSIAFFGSGIFSKWHLLAANLTLTQSLFPFIAYTFSYNSVSWSISTEVFFYLAFPLLLINIRRTWHWKLAASALIVLVIATACDALPAKGDVFQMTMGSAVYANPLVRGFEFCLGMSTWVIWDRYIKPMRVSFVGWTAAEFGVLTLIFAWLSVNVWPIRNGIPTSALQVVFNESGCCLPFALLIAVIASGQGWISKALSSKVPVFLGHISFSIYMVHQVLMKMFVTWGQAQTVSSMAFFATLLFVASGSCLMIEKPAQRFLTKLRAPASKLQVTEANVQTPPAFFADQP